MFIEAAIFDKADFNVLFWSGFWLSLYQIATKRNFLLFRALSILTLPVLGRFSDSP